MSQGAAGGAPTPVVAEPLVPQLPDLVAHFFQRQGGVSEGPYHSLNLGFSTGDCAEAVVENRARCAMAIAAPLDRWVVAGQVHGAEVARVSRHDAGEGARARSLRYAQQDAVVLTEPGVFALGLSADCPLLVIADPVARRAALAHAGWRGTVAGVVEVVVRALAALGSAPATLHAGISPGICGSCYEVGHEVFDALAGRAGLAAARRDRYLDLRTIHQATLIELGVDPQRIALHPGCSACAPERYFSHRRDHGRTGRGGALVGWR